MGEEEHDVDVDEVQPRHFNLKFYAPVVVWLLLLAGCGGGGGSTSAPVSPPPGGDPQTIVLRNAFPNLSFNQPLLMLQAPGDSSTWYVVERAGVIRVFDNDLGVNASRVFADLRPVVDSVPNEAGLLGVAFHPDYANNRQVFLSFTVSGAPLVSRVERLTSTDGGLTLDLASRSLLLSVPQDFGNHNGGNIAFGPDGYLYIGFGDGGSGGDPNGRAQATNNLMGTIARIDVDRAEPYTIPIDNPFAGSGLCTAGSGAAACPEIFAFGLRNPWRWSFDSVTGDLFAGDVGQGAFEEIDRVTIGNNYGWNIREGANCFNSTQCVIAGLIDPIHEYGRSEGASVTGGYVYRGVNIPALSGRYIFADFISGKIWSIDSAAQSLVESDLLLDSDLNIASFGQSNAGELYVVDFVGGTLHEIIAN
jgi:glucose/arabinose dehydrogenase